METLNKIIEIIKNKITKEEDERELSRILLRNCNVPFLREITGEVLVIDLLGLEYKKISNDIFIITKVNKNYQNKLMVGDYILGPKLIDKNDFNDKKVCIKFDLLIYRKNKKTNFIKKHFKINLIPKKEIENLEGYYYLPIENFHFRINTSFSNSKGIIIDLRNNGGGQLNLMIDLYWQIFEKKILMCRSKENTINFFINALNNYTKKVYILVNEYTASAAEIFAYIAQKCECAKIIGTKTYGKNYLCKPIEIGTIKISYPIYKYVILGRELSDFKPDYNFDDINNIGINDVPKLIKKYENK